MAGTTKIFEASTKTELHRAVKAWEKEARNVGWSVVFGYVPENVEETDSGYAILVRAHT